jgi:hypothetical protein
MQEKHPDERLERIADDSEDRWIGPFVDDGIAQLEQLLRRYAAFDDFLDGRRAA